MHFPRWGIAYPPFISCVSCLVCASYQGVYTGNAAYLQVVAKREVPPQSNLTWDTAGTDACQGHMICPTGCEANTTTDKVV